MISKNVIINGIKDVVIKEEKIEDTQLKPTECLIETDVSLISPGTELSRVFGLKKGAAYPTRPGYCSVGKILKKGEKVYQAEVGDVVLFSGPHSSHQIYDYTTSDGGILYKLNDETMSEEGAFLMMCWISMNGILPADVKLGDTVAILGLGTIGLILSILYKQAGANVISVDPESHRCELAQSMGIENTVDCEPSQQFDVIMELTNQKGADIVVDASGLSECIETCIKVAAKYGQVLLLGSPRTDYTTNITPMFNMIHTKMLNVIGCFNRRYPYDEKEGSRLYINKSLKYLESLLNNKIIDVNKFTSHRITPDNIMYAYNGLMNKKNKFTTVFIDWKKG